MKGIIKPAIILAIVLAVVGGISRITLVPVIVVSRVYFGAAVFLLLLAIAIGIEEMVKK